jgi:hypothetical protein
VISYPCGSCIDYGSGLFAQYSCDSSDLTMNLFMTTDCTGAPYYSYPFLSLGCAATSTQVTVSSCDVGAPKVVASPPKQVAAIEAAQKATREAAEKVAASIKAAAVKQLA